MVEWEWIFIASYKIGQQTERDREMKEKHRGKGSRWWKKSRKEANLGFSKAELSFRAGISSTVHYNGS